MEVAESKGKVEEVQIAEKMGPQNKHSLLL